MCVMIVNVHLYIFITYYKQQTKYSIMRKSNNYNLHEFIINVINRKNMYRHDKVIFDYYDLYDKQVDGSTIKYKTDVNGKSYNVYINSDGNVQTLEVSVNGYAFEIGEIKMNQVQPDTTIVTIECDVLFY